MSLNCLEWKLSAQCTVQKTGFKWPPIVFLVLDRRLSWHWCSQHHTHCIDCSLLLAPKG